MEQHTNEIVFIVSAIIGLIAHYYKKYFMSETDVKISEWFGISGIKYTIAALGTFATAVITVLSSGAISPEMSIWTVIYTGITTGIAADTINSDGKKPAQIEDNS